MNGPIDSSASRMAAVALLLLAAGVAVVRADSVDRMEFYLLGKGYDAATTFSMTITTRQEVHDAGTPFEATVTKYDGEATFDVATMNPPLEPGPYLIRVRAHSAQTDLWSESNPPALLYVFESFPTVSSVDYWIDQNEAGAVTIAAPADGAWDSARELFSATISIAGIAPGDHTLFLRTLNSGGVASERHRVRFTVFSDNPTVIVQEMEAALGSTTDLEPLPEDPRQTVTASDGAFDEPREAFSLQIPAPPSEGDFRVFMRGRRQGTFGEPYGPWSFIDFTVSADATPSPTPTPTPTPSPTPTPRPIPPPTGLRARSGADSILLQWNPNPEAFLAGYEVFRETSATGAFDTLLSDPLLTDPRFTDATAPRTQVFFYRVRALSDEGAVSPLSATVSAAVGSIEALMGDMRATPGGEARLRVSLANAAGVAASTSGSAMNVRISYSPALLTPTAVERTFLTRDFSLSSNIGSANGLLNITGITASGAIAAGEGPILDVLFSVAASAVTGQTSTLTFNDVRLFDALGNALDVDFSDTALFEVESLSILGDVNGDGEVDAADALLALRIATKQIDSTPLQLSAGDVNNDGEIDASDVTLILRINNFLPINPFEAAPNEATPQTTGGAGDHLVSAIASAAEVEVGGESEVLIVIDNSLSVASIDLTFNFDPSVLRLTDVAKGTLLDEKFQIQHNPDFNPEGGVLLVSFSSDTALSGEAGTLLRLKFTAVGESGTETKLTLARIKLGGEFGEDLAWDGTVEKQGTTVMIVPSNAVRQDWHLYR